MEMDKIIEDWVLPIFAMTAILWFAKKGGPAVMVVTGVIFFFGYLGFHYRKIKR